jgi:hypothetical protein
VNPFRNWLLNIWKHDHAAEEMISKRNEVLGIDRLPRNDTWSRPTIWQPNKVGGTIGSRTMLKGFDGRKHQVILPIGEGHWNAHHQSDKSHTSRRNHSIIFLSQSYKVQVSECPDSSPPISRRTGAHGN